ncbi:MAG: hypothetical protein PWQ82_1050 [Thermosediminibacterales bacterium]|nr:hypothetical protein [Thermosediminibacterales bacterium]MDK2836301.1 hypothetical protein [Thermosediminibacterales bacterium]
MSKKWYPIINLEKCSGCMACVDFCSHGVYEVRNDAPYVIKPEACVEGCRGCQKKCPESAIEYAGDDGSFASGSCCCCS